MKITKSYVCHRSSTWSDAVSDDESDSSGEEAGPGDLTQIGDLVVGLEEGHAVDVAVVLDLAVDLVSEECLDGIVELVLVQVATEVADEVVRPVSVLDSVEKTVVLSNPKAILEGLKVNSGVDGVS